MTLRATKHIAFLCLISTTLPLCAMNNQNMSKRQIMLENGKVWLYTGASFAVAFAGEKLSEVVQDKLGPLPGLFTRAGTCAVTWMIADFGGRQQEELDRHDHMYGPSGWLLWMMRGFIRLKSVHYALSGIPFSLQEA